MFLKILQFQHLAIVLSLVYGVSQRKKRSKHIFIMKSAILWDCVFAIETLAYQNYFSGLTKTLVNAPFVYFHQSLVGASVLLYPLMIFTGYRILKGNNQTRKMHQLIGWTTLLVRAAALVTSGLFNFFGQLAFH